MGVITIIHGGILVANYGVPGWGVTVVRVAAVFAFIGGFFIVYQSFKMRKV
jgi:hypothetical protein